MHQPQIMMAHHVLQESAVNYTRYPHLELPPPPEDVRVNLV